MTIIAYVFFVFLLLVILVCVIRRKSLPCPSWLGWMVEKENPFTKTNRSGEIINHLELNPGMKVLDAGCGPGRVTIPIAKKVGPNGTVTAMDIQQKMLQRVKKKALAENLNNIQFLQAGIGEGKLENNKYDRAILVSVLGEIPNRKAAIKEIFNSLNPGGILVITEVIFDPHFQSKKTVIKLTESVGFRLKEVIGNRFAFTMQLEKPRV